VWEVSLGGHGPGALWSAGLRSAAMRHMCMYVVHVHVVGPPATTNLEEAVLRLQVGEGGRGHELIPAGEVGSHKLRWGPTGRERVGSHGVCRRGLWAEGTSSYL
jgi:hypothetical protein